MWYKSDVVRESADTCSYVVISKLHWKGPFKNEPLFEFLKCGPLMAQGVLVWSSYSSVSGSFVKELCIKKENPTLKLLFLQYFGIVKSRCFHKYYIWSSQQSC